MKYNLIASFMLLAGTEAWSQNDLAFYRPKTPVTRPFDPLKPAISYRRTTEPTIRPFITDDARVVGRRLAQMESWLRFDREAGQHWTLFAYGPTKKLELTMGGVMGYERDPETRRTAFSYALPLAQAKFLFNEYRPNRAPGFGAVIGTFIPGGRGSFRPAGYGTFGYLIVTQSLGENDRVLLHGNLGGNYLHIDGSNQFINTWGVGTQIRAHGGMNLVGEVFSGDPYIPGTGMAYQVGYRYIFSELVQIDMTVGNGIAGENRMPFWFSAGVRLVTERFLHKRDKKL